MRRLAVFALCAIQILCASAPTHACRLRKPIDFSDVKRASVVVVGRISNYKIIVRDDEFRRRMLADQKRPPDMREFSSGEYELISDHAKFDVAVDEVLLGNPPATISVTWVNSTFSLPSEMDAGPFLIALRDPDSPPPNRLWSGTISPNKASVIMSVLQAPCSRPFLFGSTSPEVVTVRDILGATAR